MVEEKRPPFVPRILSLGEGERECIPLAEVIEIGGDWVEKEYIWSDIREALKGGTLLAVGITEGKSVSIDPRWLEFIETFEDGAEYSLDGGGSIRFDAIKAGKRGISVPEVLSHVAFEDSGFETVWPGSTGVQPAKGSSEAVYTRADGSGGHDLIAPASRSKRFIEVGANGARKGRRLEPEGGRLDPQKAESKKPGRPSAKSVICRALGELQFDPKTPLSRIADMVAERCGKKLDKCKGWSEVTVCRHISAWLQKKS